MICAPIGRHLRIPALVDGTKIPPARDLPEGVRDLVYRQAADVSSGRLPPSHGSVDQRHDQLLALLGRASSPAPEVSAQGKVVRTGPRDPKTAPAQKEASRTLHSQSFQSADANCSTYRQKVPRAADLQSSC